MFSVWYCYGVLRYSRRCRPGGGENCRRRCTENNFTDCYRINLALTRLTRARLKSSSCLLSDMVYVFPHGKFDVTPTRSATYHELGGINSLKFPFPRNSLLSGFAPHVVGVRLPGGRLPLTIPKEHFFC